MQEFDKGLYLDRNAKVVAFLAEILLLRTKPTKVAPNKELPGYMEVSLYKEIYHRIWTSLSEALPEDCRTIACGHAALQYPPTGLLLAIGFGMHYMLRVPDEAQTEHAGLFRLKTRSPCLDVRQVLGPDWRVGAFLEAEIEWCKASYQLAARE